MRERVALRRGRAKAVRGAVGVQDALRRALPQAGAGRGYRRGVDGCGWSGRRGGEVGGCAGADEGRGRGGAEARIGCGRCSVSLSAECGGVGRASSAAVAVDGGVVLGRGLGGAGAVAFPVAVTVSFAGGGLATSGGRGGNGGRGGGLFARRDGGGRGVGRGPRGFGHGCEGGKELFEERGVKEVESDGVGGGRGGDEGSTGGRARVWAGGRRRICHESEEAERSVDSMAEELERSASCGRLGGVERVGEKCLLGKTRPRPLSDFVCVAVRCHGAGIMTSGGTRLFAGSVRGFEVPPARVVIHVIPPSTGQPNEPSARSLFD